MQRTERKIDDNSTMVAGGNSTVGGGGVDREDILDDCWKGAVDMAVGVPATLHALWLLR